ncbi:hypothetical protein L1987_20291 [Smallanthus sonchifolius]|uniref:Uncharacterized protein n=1 Tax=Smallanthus sonchifolius TaxID=185202 RepID=A0ACB9IQX3_9ASTR|nr:hypothetical protein L1987_20291 [Smallanthus sonchifolius]
MSLVLLVLLILFLKVINANIPRENCILVEPDENGVLKQKVQVVIPQFSKEGDVYEQESEDTFFKKQFVKQSQHSNVKGKGNQFQENRYHHQHVSPSVKMNAKKNVVSQQVIKVELGDGAKDIVDPVLPEQPVNEAENDNNIQDAPIQDHVMPNSPREGVVEDASVSESTKSDDNDPDVAPTTTTTQVGTSGSPSVTIPVSASNVSPPISSCTTRSTSNHRKEQDDNAHMVLVLVDLKFRVPSLENIAGGSSCRQENVIIPDNDDDDTEGAQGKDEQQIASSKPSVSLAGKSNAQGESSEGNKGDGQQVNENVREHVDKETLDCLIDDWESDVEDVEIEFEHDDEVVKYATHEGVEFDTSFID